MTKLNDRLDETTKFISSPLVIHIRKHYMRINKSLAKSGSAYLYCSLCVRLTKNRGYCCECDITCCDLCGFTNNETYICGVCVTQCPKCNRIVRKTDTQLLTTNDDDYDICNDCFPSIKNELINSDKFYCFDLKKAN